MLNVQCLINVTIVDQHTSWCCFGEALLGLEADDFIFLDGFNELNGGHF